MFVIDDHLGGHVRSRVIAGVRAVLVACMAMSVFAGGAAAEQGSEPASPAAGLLDAGWFHSCAVLIAGRVRCWGYGGDGQLGYGNPASIGDDETPASAGPVNLGPGRSAKAIAAGDFHSCALLDNASVRCWGYGGDGRLGYASTADVRDPGAVGPVDLGGPAKAISADAAHTCAVLEDGSVRCWGYGGGGFPQDGRLGYDRPDNVGDNETPGSAGPVKLGAGRTAVAISAGRQHTCALLDDQTVKCWGRSDSGKLGRGSTNTPGRPAMTPDTVAPVNLGPGRTAKAISAGGTHTCALLDDRSVRCWGEAGAGQLGYGNTEDIGDDETPGSAGPVDVGAGRTVAAITAGDVHTCARLDDGSVRCWGFGAFGRLGYPTASSFGHQDNVGDDETPGSIGPIDLGAGRTATAISAGRNHTCARLDDASLRCWGQGAYGRLGYCDQNSIGDDEPPGAVGPVDLGEPGTGATGCHPASSAPASRGGSPSVPTAGPPATGASPTAVRKRLVFRSDAARAPGLSRCLAAVASHAERERRLARRGSARQQTRARDHQHRYVISGGRRCLRLYARAPGRIAGLRALSIARTQITLGFTAPGTNRSHPPPVRSYLVKQSLHPIRSDRDFARAPTLCKGRCRFDVPWVGARVSLIVTDLRPRTTYYYALAARDNLSGRLGPRSQAVKVRTA
jgi:alpha-tubulin suppressor-like RCC1 family protein